MTENKKVVRLWNVNVELYDGRTPLPVLETAVRSLPDNFLKVVGSSHQSDISDLAVVGDNCYGCYIIPKEPARVEEINVPGMVKLAPYENPEGRFVSFTYNSSVYTVRISSFNKVKINGVEHHVSPV